MHQKTPKSRIAEEIDANLKRAFDDISTEAVPARFASLLDQLRASEDGENRKESRREP